MDACRREFLVTRGLDVRTLLLRFGLRISTRADAFSTIGLACMPIWLKPRNWQRTAESATTHAFRPHFGTDFAHKAASPLRFVPTVALTPVVARSMQRIFGKKEDAQAHHVA